jgi:hypothetical protein
MKRFKDRLKQFDSALERLHDEKANRKEFDMLCHSLDKHRAETIFNDMKRLVD